MMSRPGATAFPPAVTCFPSSLSNYYPNTAAAETTVSSVRECLLDPSASLYCQFDSNCITNTYTVGIQPLASPTSALGTDLFIDGGSEDGILGGWTQDSDLNSKLLNIRLNGDRPRSGRFGISTHYDNINGASVTWTRTINLIPDKTCQLQNYYYSTNPRPECWVFLASDFNDNSLNSPLSSDPANHWVSKTLTFTAIKSWSIIYMGFGCNVAGEPRSADGINSVWLDDWTLKQVDL